MHPLRPLGLKRAMLPVLAGISSDPAAAQLVCYEGFGEHPGGTQVESGGNGPSGTGIDGGIGWAGPYDVSNAIKTLVKIEDRSANPVNYTNGEISIAGGNRALRFSEAANGSYAVERPLGTVFDAAAGDTLWFSFLFRTASASPLGSQDFFQVGFDNNPNASSGTPRVSVGANTISASFPSAFQFFARSTTAIPASVYHGSLPIAAVTTYLLVGRIQPNAGVYDTVNLWVNPSTLADPGPASASSILPSGLTTLSHAFIRTAFLDPGDVYVMDELYIGRDYGSVVPSLRSALTLLPETDFLTLRWPAYLSGVVLETSTTLEPESWTEMTGPFPRIGHHYEYLFTVDPEIPRAFFRLRR